MQVVIAEKPSVGISIAKVLGADNKCDGYYEGNGYYVSWCVGHLVALSVAENYNSDFAKWNYNDLPILPTKWQYTVAKDKEKQMNIIQSLFENPDVDSIICATDAGREGELIFRLVYNKLQCTKPVKRLWISSLEDEAISNGFANLHDSKDFDNLYNAALCRAKADWIVGINATRLFSVLYNQTLNIGRVMSPTLAMIVERNSAIDAFKSKSFYNVSLNCGTFSLCSDRIDEKFIANKIMLQCNNSTLTVEKVDCKKRTEKPPKPYDLTTLQREANKALGFTAQQTLQYAQSLYEQKLITYPRTDSRYLTEDMKNNISNVINASSVIISTEVKGSNIEQIIDNNKVSDHHAIIPTVKAKTVNLNSLPVGEREILKLIATKLLISICENHIYEETEITGICSSIQFTTKGKKVIQKGFKEIQNSYIPNDEENSNLPDIQIGDTFTVKSSVQEGKTSPPKAFTDNTLLASMENANKSVDDCERKGIGTPATRAGIMEKLIKSELIERKGTGKAKYFSPTHKGISLVTVLPEAISSPLLTAQWEEKLKFIENGNLHPQTFLDEIDLMITELVK